MGNYLEHRISRRGMLRVNLPIFLIILSCWLILISFNFFSIQKSALISGAIGWIYWEFAVVKWIRWSLSQGIDKEVLYKIGKRNLLVWSQLKIDEVAKKMEEFK